jgi:hypothetical protein
MMKSTLQLFLKTHPSATQPRYVWDGRGVVHDFVQACDGP